MNVLSVAIIYQIIMHCVCWLSALVTVVCLVLAERNRRQNLRHMSITEDDLPASISSCVVNSGSREKLMPGKYDALYVSYGDWKWMQLFEYVGEMHNASFCPFLRFDGQTSTDFLTDGESNSRARRDSLSSYCEDDLHLTRHFVFLIFLTCSFIVVGLGYLIKPDAYVERICSFLIHVVAEFIAAPVGVGKRWPSRIICGDAFLRDNLTKGSSVDWVLYFRVGLSESDKAFDKMVCRLVESGI